MYVWSLADPAFGQGGPQKFFPKFCQCIKAELGKLSEPISAGVKGLPRALEALAFLTIKYAFSHFSWYFSSNF